MALPISYVENFCCCSKAVKNCLFRTFVSCLYGSTVWCVCRKSTVNRLRVGYNNAYRILFNFPRRTSMSTMLVQNNVPTFHALIRKHIANFMLRCINSCNVWLSSLVEDQVTLGPVNAIIILQTCTRISNLDHIVIPQEQTITFYLL